MSPAPEFLEAWYCARTKPKHEHIAAANVVRQFGIPVFSPRIHFERATRRGPVRCVESLFPCYIFVHCRTSDLLTLRYAGGISSVVHFGCSVPAVPDAVIGELQECFENQEPMALEDKICPGAEVSVREGAFRGFQATVLRTLPARRRVQVLLDVLGRQTLVELDRDSVIVEQRSMADMLPLLAVTA